MSRPKEGNQFRYVPIEPGGRVLLRSLLLERLLQIHRIFGRQIDLTQPIFVHHQIAFAFVLEQSTILFVVLRFCFGIVWLTIAGQVVTCRTG